jgi:hypothetical protein
MMNMSLRPMPKGTDLRLFLSTIRELLQNKRGEEMLSLLAEAVAESERASENLRRERVKLAEAKAVHDRLIAGERSEHDVQLANERTAWNNEVVHRRKQLEADEQQIAKLKEQAEKDGKAAAALRRDLEGRLARMRDIAA